jgi:hypothetical protein
LADYGYHFNDEGELRHLETGTPFQFINQKHYEAMGDMIVRHIQEAMLKEYQLTEQIIPLHDVTMLFAPLAHHLGAQPHIHRSHSWWLLRRAGAL